MFKLIRPDLIRIDFHDIRLMYTKEECKELKYCFIFSLLYPKKKKKENTFILKGKTPNDKIN